MEITEKQYEVRFKKHKRTSLLLDTIENNVLFAKNKESAKDLARAIVFSHYERKGYSDPEYMTRQYSYIIE